MKTQTRSRVIDSQQHYVAIKNGRCYACVVGNCAPSDLDKFCREWIEKGATIYRAGTYFLSRFVGENVPEKELSQLPMAVTEVLKCI